MRKKVRLHLFNGKALTVEMDDDAKFNLLKTSFEKKPVTNNVCLSLKSCREQKSTLMIFIESIIAIEEMPLE